MLRNRLITAGVLIPFIVPMIVLAGPAGVAVLVAIFGGIALWEFAAALPGLRQGVGRWLGMGLGAAMIAATYALPGRSVGVVAVAAPLVVLAIHLVLFHRIEKTVDSASQMVLALGYVIAPLCHAVLLARLEYGAAWVMYVLLVICLGDAGAYFAGKYHGKHRLAPTISPGKTIEGLGGGFAGNLLGTILVKICVPGILPFKWLLLMTALLAVAGPLGDLCASGVKRRLQIKDYGSALPGHGGVMDRADSLIFAFPTAYYFIVIGGFYVLP
jgi:phosphatidate cytidylyltransferase